MRFTLYLANKTYSGWSLRAWLLFRHFQIDFDEYVIPLYGKEHLDFKVRHKPVRQFPALEIGASDAPFMIWDSLAITEFLSETYPKKRIWPDDKSTRAAARSLCAEMHSGFKALRSTMPMNTRRAYLTFLPDKETQADIDRITQLWSWARETFASEGPYLFGTEFTAADAFFAPVASRFRTYSINPGAREKDYCDLLLSHPAVIDYYKEAEQEKWILSHNEFDRE